MVNLKIILFVGLILGWTYAENSTEREGAIGTQVPVSVSETQNSVATGSSIQEILRIAQRQNENEIIESLSPANFIFNSCELRNHKTAPAFARKFPYYLAGFDGESRPIWVVEMGKYDLNSINGGNKTQDFEDFAKDIVFNFIKSLFIKTGPGRPTFDFIFIIDFEGFSKEQITVENVKLVLKLSRLYTRLLEEYGYSIVIINVNKAAQSLGPIVKPYAVDVLEKTSIFGLDKSEWQSFLRKTIPADQLPSFYGGKNPNYKPVRVY